MKTATAASMALMFFSPVAAFVLRTSPSTSASTVPIATSATSLSTRSVSCRKRPRCDSGGREGRTRSLSGGREASELALGFALQVVETAARPPLPTDFYRENLLDKIALSLFRKLVQGEIGYKSEQPGYAGLIDEAQNYMVVQGATEREQQDMVVRVLATIAGPAVPPVYRLFMAPWPWAPLLTALFTPLFFKFLVGPNNMDLRRDETLGGVFVERCRFLEETNCKGLCTNMCKVPTERFFDETLGMRMAMEPNFDTYECRLSFGLEAPPLEEDDTVPRGCLSRCSCKSLGAKVATTCSKQ